MKWLRKYDRPKLIGLGLMAVAVVGVGLGAWWFLFQSNQKTLVLPPKGVSVKTYSVSGKIDRVDGERIYYTAPVAYKIGNKTTIEYEPRVAIVSASTVITRSTLTQSGLTFQNIKISDLKTGQKMAAYYSTLPYDKIEAFADKIDIAANY